jgi:hypothetical protein
MRAMVWGVGVLVMLAAVVWVFRDPDSGMTGKAFTVLLSYAALFWATLFKIWWTAGRPAVLVGESALGHQPLHTFSPRQIAYDRIVACGPREGTESQRFVVAGPRRSKEFFLNLAVVKGKHDLLARLGERLEQAGLEKVGDSWRRPGEGDDAAEATEVVASADAV